MLSEEYRKILEKDPGDLVEEADRRADHISDYAYDNTDFWRNHLDEHGIDPDAINSLQALVEEVPPITDSDKRAAQDPENGYFGFLAREMGDIERILRSGGTSGGEPKLILETGEDKRRNAEYIGAGINAMGLEEGSKVYGGMMHTVRDDIEIEGDVWEVSTAFGPRFEELLDVLEGEITSDIKEADVIPGLTSHLARHGRELEMEGEIDELSADVILTFGEPSTREKREAIEERFGIPVVDGYGISEVGLPSYEDGRGGQRVNLPWSHAAIMDEDGDPVDIGGEGRLTLSRLWEVGSEPATVILQYQPGDIATLTDEYRIDGIHREGNEFFVGGVDVTTQDFERPLYGEGGPRDKFTGEYEVEKEFDEELSQEVVTVRLEREEGATVYDTDVFGYLEDIFHGNSALRHTVMERSAAGLNVETVDSLDYQGKPQRLIQG